MLVFYSMARGGNDMTKSKVFCAVAILDRSEPMMEESLFKACTSSRLANVGVYRQMGDSYIMRVRNHAVTDFISNPAYSDFEYYAMWSGDIEVLNNSAQDNVWDRLIEADKDFVGGVYAPSAEGMIKCTSVALDGKRIRLNKGLRPLLWLSGGLWLVRRSAIVRMIQEYPDVHYDGDGPFTGRTVYGLFNGTTSDRPDGTRKFLTEDYWFCERWRALAGTIWADTGIHIRHWGKRGYELQ